MCLRHRNTKRRAQSDRLLLLLFFLQRVKTTEALNILIPAKKWIISCPFLYYQLVCTHIKANIYWKKESSFYVTDLTWLVNAKVTYSIFVQYKLLPHRKQEIFKSHFHRLCSLFLLYLYVPTLHKTDRSFDPSSAVSVIIDYLLQTSYTLYFIVMLFWIEKKRKERKVKISLWTLGLAGVLLRPVA